MNYFINLYIDSMNLVYSNYSRDSIIYLLINLINVFHLLNIIGLM